MQCTTVTNFSSESKVMLLLNIVRYTYDRHAIAINKLCKSNFKYFTMYLAISQQKGLSGLFYIRSLLF